MTRVLVVGASRGIGLEFVRQYRAEGAAVKATARSETGLAALRALGAAAIALDVTDAASAAGLAEVIDGAAFDIAIVNAGVFGPRTNGLAVPTETEFDAVMHTNVLGAMRVLVQLEGQLAPGAKVAVLSSRMGSIGLATSSNGWLYRASKAALNAVLAVTAQHWAGRAICVAISPGWVRTDMGGASADLEVADSVRAMRATLARLSPADNGRFVGHDGQPIPW